MGLVIALAPDAVSSGGEGAGNQRAMGAGSGHFVIANQQVRAEVAGPMTGSQSNP